MDFSTSEFWLSLLAALPIVLVGNFLLRKKPHAEQLFHKWLIMILSLTLLGIASWQSLSIFLYVTLLAYFACKGGLRMAQGKRRLLLGIIIPLLLIPLLYYKYAYFLGTCFQAEWDTLRNLIIPIGISFYTFQIVGFCIDTLVRDEPMPGFVDYMNFGCYFPAIVAGPIERRANLLPQISKLRLYYSSADMMAGLPYIILGLFFKLALADNLALAYTTNVAHKHALTIWLFNLIFTFRIYFDFAGYGLTAYGLARCMGITLRMNFLSPYTATNITEFWRRWHTSLTTWFRDYIYFPMGGSRTKRWALNTLIVFAISGLWHGAGWNFIIWGALSGVAMVIHKTFRNMGGKIPGIIGWGATFLFMIFVWMFFYVTDSSILLSNLKTICTPEAYKLSTFFSLHPIRGAYTALPLLFIPLSIGVVCVEFISLHRTQDPYKLFLTPLACGIMVFLIVVLKPAVQNQFIYFAF